MKRRQGFPNTFTNLFVYVMDSRNSECEGICQGCIKTHPLTTCNYTRSENAFPYFLYYGQKREAQMETSQGQIPCRTQLNRMNANKSGDPGLSPGKRESQWRWFKKLFFFKVLRMLEKRKATCNFNLSNLIGSQQILKKTAALVLTISLPNALLLTIHYTHQHHRRRLGRLLSEGRGLGVESAHWRKR